MQAIPLKRRVIGNGKRSRPKKKRNSNKLCRAVKKAAANRPKKRKISKNSLAVVGALNGRKGANQMAKSRKKKKKAAPNPHRGRPTSSKGKGKRPKKNPNRSSGGAMNLSRPANMAKAGLSVLSGLLATRQLPQLLLGEKNSGVFGYAANTVTALVLAWAAGMGFGRFYGFLVGAGGGAYTIARIGTEQFTPLGKILSLSGVGDASAAGFGVIKDGSFPVPAVVDKNGRLLIPQDYLDQVRELMAAEFPGGQAQPAQMQISAPGGGMGRMNVNRFASRL